MAECQKQPYQCTQSETHPGAFKELDIVTLYATSAFCIQPPGGPPVSNSAHVPRLCMREKCRYAQLVQASCHVLNGITNSIPGKLHWECAWASVTTSMRANH